MNISPFSSCVTSALLTPFTPFKWSSRSFSVDLRMALREPALGLMRITFSPCCSTFPISDFLTIFMISSTVSPS
ncbi:Uncharacterised protein [uncultured archaeon]|nr:Uncharacterised protein [uncultured archaeon]